MLHLFIVIVLLLISMYFYITKTDTWFYFNLCISVLIVYILVILMISNQSNTLRVSGGASRTLGIDRTNTLMQEEINVSPSRDISGESNTCFYRAVAKIIYGDQRDYRRVYNNIRSRYNDVSNYDLLNKYNIDVGYSIEGNGDFDKMYRIGRTATAYFGKFVADIYKRPVFIYAEAPFGNSLGMIYRPDGTENIFDPDDLEHKHEVLDILNDPKGINLILRNNHFETLELN